MRIYPMVDTRCIVRDVPRPWILRWFLSSIVLAASLPMSAVAEIRDVTVADVTTRAFSVIWISDEPVLDAGLKVYLDENGLDEISANVDLTLVSSQYPPALDLGLIKIDVVGLEPDTTYFISLEMTTTSGSFVYPTAPPLLPVTTAVEVALAKADSPDEPIVNDLILHAIFDPDGVSPTEGTLMLIDIPGLSAYPISAFVGQGIDAPLAIADLGNLFDTAGYSAQAPEGARLLISELRGLLCPPETQRLVRVRRVPAHDETPPITELEDPALCFASGDFNCSGAVDAADFNDFLIRFGSSSSEAQPDCSFNPDFDLNTDGQVNAGDFNDFLITFGSSE